MPRDLKVFFCARLSDTGHLVAWLVPCPRRSDNLAQLRTYNPNGILSGLINGWYACQNGKVRVGRREVKSATVAV